MRRFAGTFFLFVFMLLLSEAGSARAQQPAASGTVADFSEMLEAIRAEKDLPALAAALVWNGEVIGLGAAGVCKKGTTDAAHSNNRFHLGSDTKAMTAAVAAMLVEEGRLNWESTVAQVFPEEKNLDPACAGITLEQLLRHRSGLMHDLPSEHPYRDGVWQESTSAPRQRLFLLRDVLSRAPEFPPGTKYHYSDVGYAIAGAMLEARTHQSWEDLVHTRLFQPLDMRTAGFGYPPRVGGKIFGHVQDKTGRFIPVNPGSGDDDPAALGPAGTVHCSVEDWAKFAIFQLRGWQEDTTLLTRASFVKLYTPPAGQDYAMGWLALPRAWAGGNTLSHAGSNGKYTVLAWLAPEKKLGILVAVSAGGDEAERACSKVIVTLLQRNRALVAARN